MSGGKRILIIEDDEGLSRMIGTLLARKGFAIRQVLDGEKALELVKKKSYALILADLGLPKLSGMSFIRQFRNHNHHTPIIVITSQVDVEREIRSFELGANIFHKKPINYELLFAQIDSVLKPKKDIEEIKYGPVIIQPELKRVLINKKQVNLSNKEFNLLLTLAMNQHKILTREEIITKVIDYKQDVTDSSVDTLVSRLRVKLNDFVEGGLIETVYKSGYRLKQF